MQLLVVVGKARSEWERVGKFISGVIVKVFWIIREVLSLFGGVRRGPALYVMLTKFESYGTGIALKTTWC